MLSSLENTFNQKKVLITGHSGFKGKWLCRILKNLNAKVFGFSVDPISLDGFGISSISQIVDKEYVGDINNFDLEKLILEIKPNFIFHFAAQALVRKSIEEPLITINTNTNGTCNLLEALRKYNNPCNVVLITSDKVYKNKEWIWGYRENDRLGGVDPYSASKAMAEIAIQSYLKTYNFLENKIRISVARAGNVIGGGDWSEDRIIPDLIRSIKMNKPLLIRSPKATRPWQHVLDPLFGYLQLAKILSNNNAIHGECFNFGPLNQECRTVESICLQVKEIIPEVKFLFNEESNIESNLLQLDCSKCKNLLNYSSRFDSYEAVDLTISWYKKFLKEKSHLIELIDQQIKI